MPQTPLMTRDITRTPNDTPFVPRRWIPGLAVRDACDTVVQINSEK